MHIILFVFSEVLQGDDWDEKTEARYRRSGKSREEFNGPVSKIFVIISVVRCNFILYTISILHIYGKVMRLGAAVFDAH